MNSIFKNIFGLIISVILVMITLGLLFNSLTKKSFYEESGVVKVQGLSSKVNIYKSELGVSQIFSENEKDMYFSLGYIHAQDRLWQMDLSRRVAEGRLSEILGKDVLDYDILFRTIGLNKAAARQYDKLSPKSKEILSSYCKGVNYFIESNSKQLPLEFDILNYKPEVWNPEHSLMIIKLVGWELNLSWYSDVMFGEIIKKLGIEKAKDLFPDYPEDAPYIIKGESGKNKNDTVKTDPKNVKKTSFNDQLNIEKNYSAAADLGENYFELSKQFREYFGMEGVHIGSNAWVISGKKTESGKPLLANDPHLALMAPSKWYEVSMYDNQKKYSVCGFSIPGVPGIAIGHNESITWGLTNLMCDDADFIILKKDSAGKNKYVFKNNTESLDSTVENVKIKDVPDDYIFTSYSSKQGPVVSNLAKTGFINDQKFNITAEDELLVFRWTGYEISDELEAFYKINNAHDWNEFQNSLKTFGTPALNFIYADTSGNIGFHSAGFIPIRSGFTDESSAIYPSAEGEWTGFVPFNELPSSLNPAEGYIVNANNKPQKNYKHYISNLYEPHYRAERIEELIRSNPIVTEDELKLMQTDVYSIQANDFCKYLFDAFGDSSNLTEDIKIYLDLLKNWDYEFKVNSVPATLFAQFEIELYKNLYKEILGDELFENYIFLKNIPVRNTARILKENSTALFENNFAKEQTIRKSFYDAVSALIVKYGNDINQWQWGNVHTVTMKHPLGVVPSLSPMLNIGPFKISGSGTTVNNLEYGFSGALKTGAFESYLGPSMRMIIDLSNPKSYLSIIPTGQSGQPLHRNYNDQARLWLNGDYKNVSVDFEVLKKENLKLLSLVPAE
ncbi:MAG: penicillin acylase family protein [Ignavibacteria bacterium]